MFQQLENITNVGRINECWVCHCVVHYIIFGRLWFALFVHASVTHKIPSMVCCTLVINSS